MVKTMLSALLLCVTTSTAFADDYYFITTQNNNSDIIAEIREFPGRYWGLQPGGAFLSGDNNARVWLDGRGISFESVTIDPDIMTLYLCYFVYNNAPDIPKIATGRGYIVTSTPAAGASAVRRITPIAIPESRGGEIPPMFLTYDPTIDALIDRVDRDTIIAFLTGLTGRAPITVGGHIDTIHTRYSGTADNRMAAQYLKETLEAYGYQTEYQGFYGGTLRHVAAYNADRAWAVTEGSEAIRTTDGGASWLAMSDGTGNALWGIDNVGPDSVWITGDIGTIRFSSDGGATFLPRTSSFHGFQFGIDFINNFEGWIAADSGKVIHTNTGGAAWVTQSTPSGARLYDVCFVDNQYGWAVGRDGVIVHTINGGGNWATQTSNTAQRLYGVKFINRNIGWVVGWGGVVRHTTDGGAEWQTVPLGTATEMYHVDFTDSLHGCIVGWNGEAYQTVNGGAEWTQVDAIEGADFYGIDFGTGSTGFGVGTGVLAKTTDGGATWIDQAAAIETSWRNVIATRRGTTDPSRQVIICGHMDNTSEQPLYTASGADDNGSGTGAVIEAARIFAGIPFERTIKFCLWTGEEQGLLGSAAYAAHAASRGDTIVGVFNFDMIAWDGDDDGSIDLHCGNLPSSQNIGHLFEDVLTDYGIALTPEFLTWNATDRSDHASFWNHNYPAILGIEDFAPSYHDFNPYYHTTDDNMDNIDTTMFFEFTKAAVGATATLALPDTNLVVSAVEGPIPRGFALTQNYPNPFNPSTKLAFSVPRAGRVRLEIFDLLGRTVRTLLDCPAEVGYHQINWDGRLEGGAPAASGVYVARLRFDNATKTIRMTLQK